MSLGAHSDLKDRLPPLPKKFVSHKRGVDAEGISSYKQGHRSAGREIGAYLKGPSASRVPFQLAFVDQRQKMSEIRSARKIGCTATGFVMS